MTVTDIFDDMAAALDDPAVASHLDAYLDADDDTAESVTSMFSVGDLAQADQVLRRIARIRRQWAALDDVYATEIERLTERRNAERDKADRQIARAEELLAGFHRAALAEDPKAKTIRLPHGELVARKAPDRVEVDPDVFLDAVSEDSPLVRTTIKRDPDRKALLAHIRDTGEALPGVELVTGEVRYSTRTEVDS